jgi:hypothetical protein
MKLPVCGSSTIAESGEFGRVSGSIARIGGARAMLAIAVLAAAAGFAQSTQIQNDCVLGFGISSGFPLTAAGQSVQFQNVRYGCYDWRLVYFSDGFSGLSLVVQSAPDNAGVPGSWSTFVGTVVDGVNPNTSTTFASTRLTGSPPWVRVLLSSATGSGSVSGVFYGCKQPGCSSANLAANGTVKSVGLALPVSVFSVTGSPVTTSGTLTGAFINQVANSMFAGPVSGGPAIPAFRFIVPADLPLFTSSLNGAVGASGGGTSNFLRADGSWSSPPGSGGTVSSVGLSLPGIFSVTGSPVTSTGTLTGSLANQNANLFFSGPSSGGAAAPTFRSIVAADLPLFTSSLNGAVSGSGGGTVNFLRADGSWATPAGSGGTVSSVGLALPGIFTVTGSPVTGTGTLTGSLANENANLIFSGPSTGSAAAPTFRSLVAADLPLFTTTLNGAVSASGGGTSNFLRADGSWASPAGSGGTVTSVGLSLPGIFTVTGSPVTSTGTLTGSLATQSANLVFAGPSSGGALAPTFRSLATADLPANQTIRAIGAGFDGGGSALTSGSTAVTYFTVPFACTIAAWNITVDTGTITFDVWKIATGTAIPTVANSIVASAAPAIATGTAIHSTTLTGWTTAVAANDIFGVNINTVATATKASLTLQCNAS